jgi:hypothetical protein
MLDLLIMDCGTGRLAFVFLGNPQISLEIKGLTATADFILNSAANALIPQA